MRRWCFLERADRYAVESCEPAPLLVDTIYAACSSLFEDAVRDLQDSLRYRSLPADQQNHLLENAVKEFRPHVEARIVTTRAAQHVCGL